MQDWIKDLNDFLFSYLFFNIDLFFIFKLIWFYIFLKIFSNLYLYFFKLILIDFLKFFRIYSFFFNSEILIDSTNVLKNNKNFKTYIHLIFYYFDLFLSLLFYLIFYFWMDFLWFIIYDFRWWWRKMIKTNLKVYAKDEIDPELSKIFYVHHGIHFINRLKFISFLRFIYFWFYLLYYYLNCFFKIYFLYFFKNYYYFFLLFFFSYKLNWTKKTYMFFWNIYIYFRNAVFYLYNSYFGYLSFNWYKKYTEKTLETSWVERLDDISMLNKKTLPFFIFDFLLPWSIYKEQLKYGNKSFNYFLAIFIFIFNYLILKFLHLISIKQIKSFYWVQKFYILKLKFLKYSLILFNLSLFDIFINLISIIVFRFIKIIYYFYKFIKINYYLFYKFIDNLFNFIEFNFLLILNLLYQFLYYISLFIINLIRYIFFYRLALIILFVIIFINFKYLIALSIYILDWFFQYYILDWFLLPDFLFSIGEPAEQAKYLCNLVNITILTPMNIENTKHVIYWDFIKEHSWWFLFMHCLTVIEKFFDWQFSRIWTIKIFIDWNNVYLYQLFCLTTSFKFCLILSFFEYIFIDYILEYFVDFVDWFLYISKLDIIFNNLKIFFVKNSYFVNFDWMYIFKVSYNYILKYIDLVFSNFINLISNDLKIFFWYINILFKILFIAFKEITFYLIDYLLLFKNIIYNFIEISKIFINKLFIFFFNWISDVSIGSNFFSILLLKIYDFIFKYKLSIDSVLFEIERVEQRTLKTVATLEKPYQILPSYLDGKPFYKMFLVKDLDKFNKKDLAGKLMSKYNIVQDLKRKLGYQKAIIQFLPVIRTEPIDLFAWRDPQKGVYFFTARGIYTNWYTYRESFPLMKRISNLIDASNSLDNREIISFMDNQIVSRLNDFFRWTQDIEYTIGNFDLWKPSFAGMRATTSFIPEFYDHKFPIEKSDIRMKRIKIWYRDITIQSMYEKKINYFYGYPRLFFFHPKNIYKFNYLRNPEYMFDFSLGKSYRKFYNTQLSFDLICLKYWTKFFIYRDFYVMDNFLWMVLSSRQTMHNFHFLMLLFFPIFFILVNLISGFKVLCYNNFEDYGDVRFWWRRFREKNLEEIPWVTQTLSKDVFRFFDDQTQMLLKKGKNLLKEQSSDYFNKRPFQIARWTLLKKYNLLDKHTYFKDFVLGKNFSLFHTSPVYENFWNIRFNSIKDSSNFDLLLAYGFSKDFTIRNLVFNDFVDFEELNLDKDYEKFKIFSDKFIDLCFILDRDFFNFKLPGSAYHKDIGTFSYMKSPDGVYLITDTLPYPSFNFQYWFIDLFAFFIAIYTFRLGLHDNRLALNEYSYFFGTLFGHTDISFYWNSYWFGLHWFHFNYFNVEQWPISHDFRKLKFSKYHSINALYYGPLSINFDYSFNQLNIILYRIFSMSVFVKFFFVLNVISFIICIYFWKLMRIKLVTNKSMEINKNLFDLLTQSIFSIEYLFVYFRNLLGLKPVKFGVNLVDNDLREFIFKNKFDLFLKQFKSKKSLLNFFKRLF